MFVSTSLNPTPSNYAKAKELSRLVNLPYFSRNGRSLQRLFIETDSDQAFVMEEKKLHIVHKSGSKLAFNPGSSRLRVRSLRKGGSDPFLRLFNYKPGERILDATLGLGADAIVAAHLVSSRGQVVGWEISTLIAFLVKIGIKNYTSYDKALEEAMRRIEVKKIDYRTEIFKLPPQSFDIVYFDPMFTNPNYKSNSIQTLRPFTNQASLTKEIVLQAKKIARRLVILKADRFFPFSSIGFTECHCMGYHAFGSVKGGF